MVQIKLFNLQQDTIEADLDSWVTEQMAGSDVGYRVSTVPVGSSHALVVLENDSLQAVADALVTAAQIQAAAALTAASLLAQATLDQQFPDPSPDDTSVPDDGATVVDNNLGVWKLGTGDAVLRNFNNVAHGTGDKIKFLNGIIYVRGLDANWYQWNDFGGSAQTYTLIGTEEPV